MNDFRAAYATLLSTADPAALSTRFYAVLLLFPLLAFAAYSPIGAIFSYLLFITIVIVGQLFVFVTPENYAYFLLWLWVWLEVLPFGALVQWAVITAYLWGQHFFPGSTFLVVFLNTTVPKYFPDTILIAVLNFLAATRLLDAVGWLLSFLCTNCALDRAQFTVWSVSVSNTLAAYPPTELNNTLAVLSFWTVIVFALKVAGLALVSAYLAGLALGVAAAFWPVFAALASILIAVASFLGALSLVALTGDIDALQDEVYSLRLKMQHYQTQQTAHRADLLRRIKEPFGGGSTRK